MHLAPHLASSLRVNVHSASVHEAMQYASSPALSLSLSLSLALALLDTRIQLSFTLFGSPWPPHQTSRTGSSIGKVVGCFAPSGFR